jgi:hypothetical protein
MQSPAPTEQDQNQLSDRFVECLRQQAEKLGEQAEGMTPMIAQANALLFVDALAKLHEAGLDEAIKDGNAAQASSWTRDLAILDLVISLLRNIQPLDTGEDQAETGDVAISM